MKISEFEKKEYFLDKEISKFIEENKDTLKEKNISFNYSKITPQNLIGINEYNEIFFKKMEKKLYYYIMTLLYYYYMKKREGECRKK